MTLRKTAAKETRLRAVLLDVLHPVIWFRYFDSLVISTVVTISVYFFRPLSHFV